MIFKAKMVEILQYFGLVSSQEWANFILKDLLFSAIIATGVLKVYEWIQKWRRANDIIKFLRKNNAPTRNSLRGKYLANRFLDIYDNGRSTPLRSKDEIYKRGGFGEGCWTENVMDNVLQAKGLVEIFEEKGIRKVRLSEDELTKTVIKYLVKLATRGQI